MNKKTLIIGAIIIVLIIVGVILFSHRETTISTSNGDLTVTQDSDTVTVNTNAGSLVAGEDVTLPDDFPEDVYVIDGTLRSALVLEAGKNYSVTISTNESPADVKTEYTEQAEADGWSITSSLDIQGGSNFFAEKDNRLLTVSIGTDEDGTVVVVSVSTDTD